MAQRVLWGRESPFGPTTDSARPLPLAEKVVARLFSVGGCVNTVWVSDTTRIPMGKS